MSQALKSTSTTPGFVEVQGLHHREGILDKKLLWKDNLCTGQLSLTAGGNPHVQDSSYSLLSNDIPEGNFMLLLRKQASLSL